MTTPVRSTAARSLFLGSVTLALLLSPILAGDLGRYWVVNPDSGDRWDLALRHAVAYSVTSYGRQQVHVLLTSQPINRTRLAEELGTGEEDPPTSHGPHGSYVALEICDFPTEGDMHLCNARAALQGWSGPIDLEPSPVQDLSLGDGRLRLRLLSDASADEGFDVHLDLPVHSLPVTADEVALAGGEAVRGPVGHYWFEVGRTGDRYDLVLVDAAALPGESLEDGTAVIRLVVTTQPINRERMAQERVSKPGFWRPHGAHVAFDLCELPAGLMICGRHSHLGGVSDSSVGRLGTASLTRDGERLVGSMTWEEPAGKGEDRFGYDLQIDTPIEPE